MMLRLLIAACLLAPGIARADCAFENDTPIRSLSAGFEAWKSVAAAWEECGGVEAELDQEFRSKQVPAFAADPALYHIGGVANGTLTPLLSEGLIRPLDDLIERHGAQVADNQRIRVDGETMAIAMMVNAQHLMFRRDVFEELGLAVPTSWDEALEAAEAIREAGVMDNPLGMTFKAGWTLGQEFNNLFQAFGGRHFDEAGRLAVEGEPALRALALMRRMTEYMDPEYFTADATSVQQSMQQGRIAMANLWASRAAAMEDPEQSAVVGKVALAAAPRAVPGGPASATLFWDGVVIAKNVSDEEAELAFRIVMEGLDREMVAENNDEAVWLVEGYAPGAAAKGVVDTLAAGAPAYPSTPQMGVVHGAVAAAVAKHLAGELDEDETLALIAEEYAARAQEAGLAD